MTDLASKRIDDTLSKQRHLMNDVIMKDVMSVGNGNNWLHGCLLHREEEAV